MGGKKTKKKNGQHQRGIVEEDQVVLSKKIKCYKKIALCSFRLKFLSCVEFWHAATKIHSP